MQTSVNCPECLSVFQVQEHKLEKDIECPNCYNIFVPKMQEEYFQQSKYYNKDEQFKPNMFSYIIFGWFFTNVVLWIWALGAIINFFLFLFSFEFYFFVFFVVFVILSLLGFVLLKIMYNKERYLIQDNQIVYWYGTLFQDNEIKLNMKKIVQVKTVLWFFQWYIFGTWSIVIKSAGSGSTNIVINNVQKPLQLHTLIHSVMKENWFNLSKEKLVQETRPHTIWVVLDVLGRYLWGLAIAIFVFYEILQEVILYTGVFGLILAWIIVLSIPITFTYLDLKRRNYRIFTDAVYFTDGFFTRRYSFIPFENISDVANQQNFFEKIFGIHDVTLSGQWTHNQVVFKNMLYWETMMENIRYLKDKTVLSSSSEEKQTHWGITQDNLQSSWDSKAEVDDQIWYKNFLEEPLDYDKSFQGKYRMHMWKNIITTIPFLIIPPFFLIILLYKIILVKYTTFFVKSDTIEAKFDFLSNVQGVFSIEKITKVDFRESLIDKLFGTCSIRFSSIWSGSDIVFKDIKKTEGLYKSIENKLWIQKEELLKEFDVKFTIKDYIKSDIMMFFYFVLALVPLSVFLIYFLTFEMIFLVLFLFALVIISKIVYLSYYYSPNWYNHNMYKDVVESIYWIIIQNRSYSLIRYLKWIKTTKYPLTSTGSIYINVAWEQVINTGQWTHVKSNYIQIDFIKNIFEKLDQVDELLSVDGLDTTKLKDDKPCLWNILLPSGIVIWILFLLLIFATNVKMIWFDSLDSFITGGIVWIGFLIVWVIYLAIIAWYVRVQFFRIEKSRILHRYGIIYKTYHSIRWDRIDFVESYQWFWNKIFKNGNVYIYTVWSSATEMIINNIDEYQEFYRELKT